MAAAASGSGSSSGSRRRRYDYDVRTKRRRQPATTRVYVGNLPSRISVSEVKEHFRKYRRRFDIMLKERYGFLVSPDPRDVDLGPTDPVEPRFGIFIKLRLGSHVPLVFALFLLVEGPPPLSGLVFSIPAILFSF